MLEMSLSVAHLFTTQLLYMCRRTIWRRSECDDTLNALFVYRHRRFYDQSQRNRIKSNKLNLKQSISDKDQSTLVISDLQKKIKSTFRRRSRI